MLNIAYCFDDNFNIQAMTSMYSFLENSKEKINFYVIHQTYSDENFIHPKIKIHENLNSISVKKFRKSSIDFPNLKRVHISEATYYRLYLSEYLPKNIENLIYVDADVISNTALNVDEIFINLKKEKLEIAANTEFFKNEENRVNIFKELGLGADRYFNAGVLFINFQLWKKNKIEESLRKILSSNEYLRFWDQDVLNLYFDGKYFELESEFNYRIRLKSSPPLINSTNPKPKIIHFCGATKPWHLQSIVIKDNSEIYQSYFRKLFDTYFHITKSKFSLLYLLLNGEFKNFRYKKELLKSFFKITKNLKHIS